MTRFAIEHPLIRLGSEGQLNITLLFGFSPRLPFPETYEDFRRVVRLAKSLEFDIDGTRKRTVTISVGAAVIPQHAHNAIRPLEFGPRKGSLAGPLERLANYAAQPGSEVDILRFGMEDTPYLLDQSQGMTVTDNLGLGIQCKEALAEAGVEILTSLPDIRKRLGVSRSH